MNYFQSTNTVVHTSKKPYKGSRQNNRRTGNPLKGLTIMDLGSRNYQEVWDMQKALQSKRINGEIEDTLLLVEHEPVYTLGKNGDENHLLQNYPEEINIFKVERGGDITFHGPGQLVGYPILDLHNYKLSINWYMRSLEETIINTLQYFGIEGKRIEGLTGVWVGDNKIAAFGVRVSRWVTMHGFALNVSPDLRYYDGIIPCGLFEYGVISMEKILGHKVEFEHVKQILIHEFSHIFKQNNLEVI